MELRNLELSRLFPIIAFATLLTAMTAVVMGGVVRVTGSGLGCPDWPLCHGSVIPPWELSPWLEYTHRLSAAVSGIFTFIMTITAFKLYGRLNIYTYLVLLASILLMIQAILGAYTVLSELRPIIALIHTAVGTSLIGVLTIIAAITLKPTWIQQGVSVNSQLHRFKYLMAVLGVATFILIISGAYVTRTEGAPLACVGMPFCGISIGNMVEIQWIHMIHRSIGLAVGILMCVILVRSISMQHASIMAAICLMTTLLAIQIGLGIGNVMLGLPMAVRAMHLVTGMMFFTVVMFLTANLWHDMPKT